MSTAVKLTESLAPVIELQTRLGENMQQLFTKGGMSMTSMERENNIKQYQTISNNIKPSLTAVMGKSKTKK